VIEVLRAGALTTVQDTGRAAHRALGISAGGALDPLALALANRLAGNPADAACLEVTLGTVALRFTGAARLGLAGAEYGATLDALAVHAGWSYPVRAGQTLTLRAARHGMRVYVAVSGGIDVPVVLGARATDLAGGFGGLEGRPLRDGDRLACGAAAPPSGVPPFGLRPPWWCRFARVAGSCAASDEAIRLTVRALPGPALDGFDPRARDLLFDTAWRVTQDSNRMGYRLAGPALAAAGASQLSQAVLPGVVQAPGGGQPIVLMGDAQTTGGYPIAAVVIQADLWRLAQARPGAVLRFARCTHDEARSLLRAQRRYLAQIARAAAEALCAGA
jgi:biotin-dependent carboxylase-like uncharacterized protein